MADTSPIVKNVLWFAAGVFCMFLIFWFVLKPQIEDAHNAQIKAISEKLQTNSEAQQTIAQLKGLLQSASEQNDACQGKFIRGTYLYEAGVLAGPSRRWWLPVDVEPVYLGQTNGSFSHYDPKTQTETIHFQPKTQ